VFRKMQSRVSTRAVESPLNQYSLLSVEEVPNDNEEVDDQKVDDQTRRKHPNTNSEVGTQTQKNQLRSRDKSSSKSKGGFPVLSRSSSLRVMHEHFHPITMLNS
jgi:hypothetical protein